MSSRKFNGLLAYSRASVIVSGEAKDLFQRKWFRELMPTLFRFLTVVGGSAALLYGSMYLLATQFEPEPQPVAKKIPNIRINR